MINIVILSDPRYPINREAIKAAALEVLQKNRVGGNIELDINIVGDRKMHDLNKQFRGIDSTTDILTFALEDPHPQTSVGAKGFIASPDRVLRLGSIVVSYPQAVEYAVEEKMSVEGGINFLVAHGVDHLLGHHHEE